MSLYIFIVIVILLIVGIIYTWYLHEKNESDIKKIQEEIVSINFDDINEEFLRLADFNFTGVSLKTYQDENLKLSEIKSQSISDINEELENLTVLNSNYKVFSVHKAIKQQNNKLNEIDTELGNISDTLKKLSESGKINANQADELKNNYQELRKEILSKSFVYGPATDNIKKELTFIEELFTKEQDLTEHGDHLEAQNMLSDIENRINNVKDALKKIEPLYKDLSEVFPGQLEEINNIYRDLKEKNVSFPSPDITESIDHITNAINDAKYKLAVLDFESVSVDNESIAIEIDQIYEQIETEIKAREKAQSQKTSVKEFINHAHEQNKLLKEELIGTTDNYILVNGEIESVEQLSEKIEILTDNFNDYSLKFDRAPLVYTEVLKFYKDAKQNLTEIEVKQKSIHEEISSMLKAEKVARNSVNSFKNEMKKQKRILEQMSLNGLPESYIDYFNMVNNELNQLENQLKEPKINVEEISKQLIIVQEDSENLSQKTNELINNVQLAQKVIQYSNRYISENKAIKEASKKAFNLYENDYEYDQALAVMSEALEKVEPGATQRLKDSIGA